MPLKFIRGASLTNRREPIFMRRGISSTFCLLGLFLCAPAFSGEPDVKQIKAELARAFPELSKANIKASPSPGLYEVEMDAQIFYVTADGKYLMMGDMMDLSGHNNLTEARRASMRQHLFDEVGEQNMIVMGPKNPKRTITVFTDVDCPYCAKLHNDVAELVKNGVKVRYLLFPRAGAGSPTYKRSVAVWCAEDRVKAIGIAKSGGKLDMKTCKNPVDQHYTLGEKLRVDGTPTIFLDNGQKIGGYVPLPRFLAMLGLAGDSAKTP
jgi:thiol:disulfide interchange protein DsbC